MSIEDVNRRQQERDDYLVALYELADGNITNWPTHRDVADAVARPVPDIMRLGMTLAQDGLCEFKGAAGEHGPVAITARGLHRAEDIIRAREAAGQPHISTVLVLSDAELRREIEPLLANLRTSIEENQDVDPDLRADAEADLQSVQDQMRAARPNRDVIRAALLRLKANWVQVMLGIATMGSAITDVVRRLH